MEALSETVQLKIIQIAPLIFDEAKKTLTEPFDFIVLFILQQKVCIF